MYKVTNECYDPEIIISHQKLVPIDSFHSIDIQSEIPANVTIMDTIN